jgi:hypothetical protein
VIVIAEPDAAIAAAFAKAARAAARAGPKCDASRTP